MPRPVIKLKPKTRPEHAKGCPKCEGWLHYRITHDDMGCVKCDYSEPVEPVDSQPKAPESLEPEFPECWTKGQLLNLRKNGDVCILTLLSEEYDPQRPERALHFPSTWECQKFISWWYARDPSAR
jgi:hypothetical protein